MNVRLAATISLGVETRDNTKVPQTPAQAAASARRKKPHTPPRSVRVPDDIWEAAKTAAEKRGETVTDAIVRYLKKYGASAS